MNHFSYHIWLIMMSSISQIRHIFWMTWWCHLSSLYNRLNLTTRIPSRDAEGIHLGSVSVQLATITWYSNPKKKTMKYSCDIPKRISFFFRRSKTIETNKVAICPKGYRRVLHRSKTIKANTDVGIGLVRRKIYTRTSRKKINTFAYLV